MFSQFDSFYTWTRHNLEDVEPYVQYVDIDWLIWIHVVLFEAFTFTVLYRFKLFFSIHLQFLFAICLMSTHILLLKSRTRECAVFPNGFDAEKTTKSIRIGKLSGVFIHYTSLFIQHEHIFQVRVINQNHENCSNTLNYTLKWK